MAEWIDSFPAPPRPSGPPPQVPQGPTAVLSSAVLDLYAGEHKMPSLALRGGERRLVALR